MNQIEQITNWFKKVFPNPTDDNRKAQLGCHLEETREMLQLVEHHTYIQSSVLYSDFLDNNIENMGFHDVCDELRKGRGEIFTNNEFKQYTTSISISSKSKFTEELCRQLFTLIGLAYMNEIDLESALQEVIRSNNTKFDDAGNPVFDENGKLIKGKNYSPPDLAGFVGE